MTGGARFPLKTVVMIFNVKTTVLLPIIIKTKARTGEKCHKIRNLHKREGPDSRKNLKFLLYQVKTKTRGTAGRGINMNGKEKINNFKEKSRTSIKKI
jgi:hypothetical protein